MKKNKISLTRIRPERSGTRHLVMGKTVAVLLRFAPADKALLQSEAKARGFSLSLYVNLILHGQEESPLA